MITELSQDELVELGSGLRASYLTEQAGYTFGLAAEDGTAIADLLPEGFLKEASDARDAVQAALQDRRLMDDDSRSAGEANRKAYKDAKVWRRKVLHRCTSAKRAGKAIPDGLLHAGRVANGPLLLQQITEMTKQLEAALPLLDGKGKDALLAEGKALCAAMSSTDASQELKRLKSLPDSVRIFRAQKGLLYIALKRINDAGAELHAASAISAARYSLSILHRRAPKRKDEPAAATQTQTQQEAQM
jgi:hypothetical protein